MRFAGELAALGTAVCWASGANLFTAAAHRLGTAPLNRLRLAFAFIFLSITVFVWKGALFPTWATPFQLGVLAVSGLIGFLFGDSYGFRSFVILGPGRASLIISLAPLFTLLMAWPILGERPGPMVWLGVALLLGGLAWVLLERAHVHHEHPEGSVAAGILFAVLAAFGQAAGYVLSKVALKTGIDPLSATLVRVTVAVVAVWGWSLFTGDAQAAVRAAKNDRVGTAFAFGGAFSGPFLGVTLSLLALEFVPAGVAASITAFYPVLTILISMRFHGEKLTARLLLGALVAVAGVIVLFLR